MSHKTDMSPRGETPHLPSPVGTPGPWSRGEGRGVVQPATLEGRERVFIVELKRLNDAISWGHRSNPPGCLWWQSDILSQVLGTQALKGV